MEVTGFLEKLKGQKVALDTMVFIYAFEEHPAYLPLIRPLFSAVEKGEMEAVTSTITLAECLVQPYRKKDMALAARYTVLFRNFPHLSLLPLTDEIAERTALLRANYRLKTPDAIQLATGLISGSRSFVTNDEALRPINGIQILVLDHLLK
ncbi:PIN domain-containing protein [Candidatus Saccharibacteria bacterium]|nr:PIN domain-containing protein [Candidatus Saccharibacteria bacterium]